MARFCGKPCNINSGGPAPPTTQATSMPSTFTVLRSNLSNMMDSCPLPGCASLRYQEMSTWLPEDGIMSGGLPITRERIAETERLIRPYVRRTPTIRVDLADFGLPARPVDFKLEFLQHTGSFKVRGAFANLLTRTVPAAGVVAASGGNHGAAVAYAARQLRKPATIFVPTVTSPAKAERIRSYGASLVIAGDRYADALPASEEFAKHKGALAVHAFDQPETLLGQGTVGL